MGLMMRTFVTLYFNLTWCKNYERFFSLLYFCQNEFLRRDWAIGCDSSSSSRSSIAFDHFDTDHEHDTRLSMPVRVGSSSECENGVRSVRSSQGFPWRRLLFVLSFSDVQGSSAATGSVRAKRPSSGKYYFLNHITRRGPQRANRGRVRFSSPSEETGKTSKEVKWA